MDLYRTKKKRLSGYHFKRVHVKARKIYNELCAQTKRRPYIRSKHFGNEKVFIDTFWERLWKKNWRDRNRRLKFLPCAIELIKYSTTQPKTKISPQKQWELLHRFGGVDPDGRIFYVQIRESTKNGQKSLMSIFPEQKALRPGVVYKPQQKG